MNSDEAARILADCRDQIDRVDRRIAALLNERARFVEVIGRVKQEIGMRIYEPKREDEVFANVINSNDGPLEHEALRRIYERILDEMRTLQKKRQETTGDQP